MLYRLNETMGIKVLLTAVLCFKPENFEASVLQVMHVVCCHRDWTKPAQSQSKSSLFTIIPPVPNTELDTQLVLDKCLWNEMNDRYLTAYIQTIICRWESKSRSVFGLTHDLPTLHTVRLVQSI